MMFRNTRMIEIEFGDCDPAGIVYFPNYFRFFDDGTAHLISAALGMKKREWIAAHGIAGIPMVKTGSEFSAPCRYGDVVEIVSEITHIGRTSFSVRHQLSNGGTLSVTGQETRVWISAEGFRPVAIPDAVRARLEDGNA
jgi:4-hydroxybenzoyl-CoA thioesterase